MFTDVAEFARTIHVKQEENEAQQQAAQQEKEEQQARQQEVEAAAGPSSVKQEQKQEEDDYGLAAMDADEELAASGKPMSPRVCFPGLQAPATPVLQQLVPQVSAGMNGLAAALPRLKPCLANTHPPACLPALPADAAAAGDNVWAGWVPASTGDGETTAADMRQKLRAKQQREQAAAAKQRRQEEEEKEEESMAREKTIGSGALLAPVTATRCCLQLASQ